ncbi:MAG: NDP-sugar synthase, partial [Clostridia bacterium]|nr:NDP-sugar synthase [Clostridia bacterium]
MAIQAIIMAGGAGTRLRPLTCDLPKPLAPLCGAPIMDYTLQLLRKHGYNHADVTLWYRPKDVQSCFGAGRHGVSLTYIIEDKPVGTAGSVLMAAGKARDTVLVMSGDGLTSVDLTAALAYHKQRKAAATLVLQRTDIPLAYGVVMTDSQGRITRFIEKPDWSRVFSSLVNTGVYLLEPQALALIPEDKPFDFGRDLFPLMLEKGMALYGWESGAYWCDVGDAQAFLKAQSDLLAGRAGFIPADPGIRAAEGAMISPDSYVASGARIGRGAAISRSCVLEGAVIGDGAQLDGAIVCAGARVEQGAVLQNGCVLGAGAVAGAFSTLQGQARVWPGIRLADDAVPAKKLLPVQFLRIAILLDPAQNGQDLAPKLALKVLAVPIQSGADHPLQKFVFIPRKKLEKLQQPFILLLSRLLRFRILFSFEKQARDPPFAPNLFQRSPKPRGDLLIS